MLEEDRKRRTTTALSKMVDYDEYKLEFADELVEWILGDTRHVGDSRSQFQDEGRSSFFRPQRPSFHPHSQLSLLRFRSSLFSRFSFVQYPTQMTMSRLRLPVLAQFRPTDVRTGYPCLGPDVQSQFRFPQIASFVAPGGALGLLDKVFDEDKESGYQGHFVRIGLSMDLCHCFYSAIMEAVGEQVKDRREIFHKHNTLDMVPLSQSCSSCAPLDE
ncbi:hypothetical protein C8J56DRAFT_1173425 [Mycena floridula]|nr:hypothetical protein C8J56DRAFT_1173425 [Mycena floridula]